MSKTTLESSLVKAKEELLRRLSSTSRHASTNKLSPNGTPADPVEFHLWSIKCHADAHADKMNISGKSHVLLPNIGQLDSHLRELNISHTDISNISALSRLPSLKKLTILASPISDFSVLSSLRNLEELELAFCGDAPIKIPHLPKLRSLKVTNTHGDIVLGDLGKLEQAEFQVLRNLSEVAHQPQLKELRFQKIENPTLEPLLAATNLRKLDVRLHGDMDLSPLAALKNLDRLRLAAPDISDISALSGLTKLTVLEIDDAQVSDANCLSSLTNLVSLNLKFCAPLNGLSFLSKMKDLSDLAFCPSNTSDLNILATLPRLKDLRLAVIAPDVDLSQLSSCSALQNLFISTDKSVLESAFQSLPSPPQLKQLNLYWVGLETLDGLEECHNLQKLYCNLTSIGSLQPLEGMKYLTQLGLAGSNVSDLSVLATLPRFLAEDPDISLSLQNTPAVKRYPELADTVAMEAGHDGLAAQHQTALKAVRAVRSHS